MTTSETMQVGEELVKLCQEGKNMEAVERLYADDVVSIEPPCKEGATPPCKGKEAVKGKSEWWYSAHEVHGGEVRGPFPHDNRFAVWFKMEVTVKETNERMTIEEVALYTVENGKVVKEEFFYSM